MHWHQSSNHMANTYTYSEIGQRIMQRNPDAFAGLNVDAEEVGRRVVERNPQLKDMVQASSAASPTEANKTTLGKTTPAPVTEPALSEVRQKDISTKEKYGALVAPNTEKPSLVGEPLKVLANLPGSTWNFVKGAIDLFNPVSTVNKLREAGSQFKALAEEQGGVGGALKAFAGELPSAAYETLIPEAGRGLIGAVGGYATGNEEKVTEGLQTAQRALVSDPTGQIAPFLIAGRAGAAALDRIGTAKGAGAGGATGGGAGAAFDTAISKVARPVIEPIKGTATRAKNFVTGTTRFGVGQATGLQPETISQVLKNPEAFSKASRATVDRASLGQEVQSALSKRTTALSETGAGYAPVRQSTIPIKVGSTWLDSTIKELTGLDIKNGKVKTTTSAKLRDAADVRAIQHLYDLWKPTFKKGTLTANEFLNFRSDLAELARFDRQIGKSQPVEGFAQQARGRFNEAYRPQLEGLEALDKEFSAQIGELTRLRKGIVDKNGNLTDAAINRIANAAGKGKDLLLARLEETLPGITNKIKVLKAVEDIQNASGIKVGTYARGAAIGGGFILGGPLQGVLTAILTSPELAVPLLRSLGLLKNSAVIRGIINALKSGASSVNQLPNQAPQIKLPTAFTPKR